MGGEVPDIRLRPGVPQHAGLQPHIQRRYLRSDAGRRTRRRTGRIAAPVSPPLLEVRRVPAPAGTRERIGRRASSRCGQPARPRRVPPNSAEPERSGAESITRIARTALRAGLAERLRRSAADIVRRLLQPFRCGAGERHLTAPNGDGLAPTSSRLSPGRKQPRSAA